MLTFILSLITLIGLPFLVSCQDADVPGFERPPISGVTQITARIGPSGGARGVGAISKQLSWGIAWYLSPTGSVGKDSIIPVVGVERGKTYTFTVYGGFDTEPIFHPLYITSSSIGGFGSLSPAERSNESIYAGIDEIETDDDGGIVKYRAFAQGALCEFKSPVRDTSMLATFEEYYNTFNTSCLQDDSITEKGGELKWTVELDTPDVVYYQCVTHRLLGYKIVVFDEGKVDLDVLRAASGGGPL